MFEDDCILGCCLTITLVTETASIPETSENFYQTTRRSILEDIHLHIRRHENLKYHQV
jgi:hypothetical protein